ncbi:MAG: DUF3153 domain-containing protein [Gomphosphaeria aponina SAG 52.96 = DSM 107014]|uniref:DUF3153 domain-containing protein n=1 Tax=Gomphosphaeria aponina SAG 52.96 = DSM 107014 TaxID=1521640 RepID=A0A941GP63_9CHRO|nr:DUF3153 domain-containing protein [Gomphosphaeria aponina SAG 52.96 = DSM 107014]
MKQLLRKKTILLVTLLMLLTGCVRYDVGVNFLSQQGGAIVQHIKLGKQLTSLNQLEGNQLLNSLENRTVKLKGKMERVSPEEVVVTIPFNNGKELVAKFEEFFNPNQENRAVGDAIDLLKLTAQISLRQSNLLLVERDRLSLIVDLRPLGLLSKQGNLIVSSGSLIDVAFVLNTPWKAKNVVNENNLIPEVSEENNQLVWQLKPGQINSIEAVFWVPSPLGWGTLVILLLILLGFRLKYQRFPWTSESLETF